MIAAPAGCKRPVGGPSGLYSTCEGDHTGFLSTDVFHSWKPVNNWGSQLNLGEVLKNWLNAQLGLTPAGPVRAIAVQDVAGQDCP